MQLIFHFGTEDRKEQQKKSPCTKDEFSEKF